MRQTETMVAQIPHKQFDEKELASEITGIEVKAEALVIETDEDYTFAGEFGKALKQKAAEVTGFFKPMKDAAYKAHKEVCDREKAMLTPLRNAEFALKRAMGNYLLEKEKQRRAVEDAARKAAEEECEIKMKEAADLESAGDTAGAEAAMEEAVIMDEAKSYTVPAAEKPKVSGVSSSKDWEITSVDAKTVPLELAGVELRPVDTAAVMRLIRASKGSINIPGITYRETTKMSFRR